MRNFADYGKLKDTILDDTGNPVRRVVYTTDRRTHLDIESDVKRKGSD